jgi:hypothetical protein
MNVQTKTVTSSTEAAANNNAEVDVAETIPKPPTSKEKQWMTWTQDVIPALIKPYAEILEQTSHLANLGSLKANPVRCDGCPNGTTITVLCLYFDCGLSKAAKCSCQHNINFIFKG